MKVIKIPFTDKVIVDRKELKILEIQRDKVQRLLNFVMTQPNPTYSVHVGYDFYVVSINTFYCPYPIKIFPFGDDEQYAKLCAEELCEMLNSKI